MELYIYQNYLMDIKEITHSHLVSPPRKASQTALHLASKIYLLAAKMRKLLLIHL